MRRWPETGRLPDGRPVPWGPDKRPPPSFSGETISPFLQAGGASYYLVSAVPLFDPRPDGVQLLAALYVPRGNVAFVKEIRVAPMMPPELADPWETRGAAPNPVEGDAVTWRTWDGDPNVRAAGTHGVWQTPFGWESYFNEGEPPPRWTWHLRLIPGNIAQLRARPGQNIGPFDPADPRTWFLVPNTPVPIAGYPGGIPGQAPSGYWPQQRMQILQGDKLSTHVFVPEHTTVCLFARWTQVAIAPLSHLEAGEGTEDGFYGPAVYPLQPSFGSLHGYIQSADSDPARENAKHGWNG